MDDLIHQFMILCERTTSDGLVETQVDVEEWIQCLIIRAQMDHEWAQTLIDHEILKGNTK